MPFQQIVLNTLCKEGKLVSTFDAEQEKKKETFLNQIVEQLDKKIAENEKLKASLDAKMPSKQVKEEQAAVHAVLDSLEKLKKEVVSASKQTKQLREKQTAVYKQYIDKETSYGKI